MAQVDCKVVERGLNSLWAPSLIGLVMWRSTLMGKLLVRMGRYDNRLMLIYINDGSMQAIGYQFRLYDTREIVIYILIFVMDEDLFYRLSLMIC